MVLQGLSPKTPAKPRNPIGNPIENFIAPGPQNRTQILSQILSISPYNSRGIRVRADRVFDRISDRIFDRIWDLAGGPGRAREKWGLEIGFPIGFLMGSVEGRSGRHERVHAGGAERGWCGVPARAPIPGPRVLPCLGFSLFATSWNSVRHRETSLCSRTLPMAMGCPVALVWACIQILLLCLLPDPIVKSYLNPYP